MVQWHASFKCISALQNISLIDRTGDKMIDDVDKLFHEPINLLLLAKGYGLEEYAYNLKKGRDRVFPFL